MTDPTIGVWLHDDGTIGKPDPYNLTRYVGNNPTNLTDPTGLAGVSVDEKGNQKLLGRQSITFTKEQIKEFRDTLAALSDKGLRGEELRDWLILEKVNAYRDGQGLDPLESADDLDPSKPWKDYGPDGVVLQMIKDHPEDGPQLWHRARLAGIKIEPTSGRWWISSWDPKAAPGQERVIEITEKTGWGPYTNPRTLGKAAENLYDALNEEVTSNFVSKWFEGVGKKLTSNVREGFKQAGLTEDLKDYEALVEEFEADVAFGTNHSWNAAKEEGKVYAAGMAAGPALAATSKILGQLRRVAKAAGRLKRGATEAQKAVAGTFQTKVLKIASKGSPGTTDAWEAIDGFRRGRTGLRPLGKVIPVPQDGRETVAFVDVAGQRFFGINGTLLTDAEHNLGREVYKAMKKQGLLEKAANCGGGSSQSLFHGEGQALMNAWDRNGKSLPKTMEMFVDRYTCAPCRSSLPELMKYLGVDTLTIYSKDGRSIVLSAAK
jgi:hypothetical protein